MNLLQKISRFLFWSLLLWIFTRIFVLQVCNVPTASMRQSLVEGDYILVNKLAFGARIPITPLSLHLGNRKFFLDWLQVPYCRLPGYSAIAHNDIVVFNLPSDNDQLPADEKKEYVKRCTGLPGDTFSIRKGHVSVNRQPAAEPEKVLQWYGITATKAQDTTLLKSLDPSYRAGGSDIFITALQAASLQKEHAMVLARKHMAPDTYVPGFFPNSPVFKWNPDSLGPFCIPKRGQLIALSPGNLALYRRLIEVYEHNTLQQRGDSVFVNNVFVRSYTFRMNYYFMMGDNRYNSIDSRFWGLVPEDHIIGTTGGVLFHASRP